MSFEDNQLLFGSDPTPRIVAIELGDTGTVKVYRREKNGATVCETEEFHPFVWADGDVADLGLTNAEKLAGDLKYNWLVTVDSWKELIALRNGLKKAGRNFFALSDPVQHYLTHTGRTLFKQLPFEELKRMQLEVLSFAGGDLEAGPDDHITSIAVSDNSGWEELIGVDPRAIDESEHAAIKRLTNLIKERDPDVIEDTTSLNSICPFLVTRARKAKTKLDWGRSGGFLRSRPSRLQIAEKTIDYPKFTVDGRHFVDTFLLAQFYDVGMRTLTGFERSDVAQHFGLTSIAEVSQLSGKELQRAWLEDPSRYRERALCAVRETRAVADLLSPSYFIQAQIFPYNYQDVIVRGNATPDQRALPPRIFSAAPRHSRDADGNDIRGRLHRHFLHGRGAQRLALRHRLALSVDHAAVRLLSGERSTPDLSPPAHRSAHLSSPGESGYARREGRGAAALLPRAAKHLQDFDQQLLRLPRFRTGEFRRLRRRRALRRSDAICSRR